MKQVVQSIRTGRVSTENVPAPLVRPGHLLIANAASVLSAGTERSLIEFGRKSLLGKARSRPDQVRRVLEKLKSDGLLATWQQVKTRLDEPFALGYSSAGRVLACGEGIHGFRVGDLVASNGPHAGVVCVPQNLCGLVPQGVLPEQAAFGVIASIALNGARLSKTSLGETALVLGLGLVGQLAVALLKAAGCRVLASDPQPDRCEIARRLGADLVSADVSAREIEDATREVGVDAVLIAAVSRTRDPIRLAEAAVRKKGRIVLLGDVPLELDRRSFYFKEAELVVACSYGPGRYDPQYEEHGRDYPLAHVRWTEQRNLQAVLDLMGAGKLDVSPLVSHRFPVAEAERAYDVMDQNEPYLGIVLEYPDSAVEPNVVSIAEKPRREESGLKVGVIGAGTFAQSTLLPALASHPNVQPVIIASSGGLSATQLGKRFGFEKVTTDASTAVGEPAVNAVFILTRHDQHAAQVLEAVSGKKHVFVEKPLCVSVAELLDIEAALGSGEPPLLMVGFNRRFSPAARRVREFFASTQAPLCVSIRFNAGPLPSEHWSRDDEIGGGRIVGEACHGIDLATYLTGSLPVRVFAEATGNLQLTDDQCLITLKHANGSVSSVAYCSGGDRALPKERVEVFGGGQVAVIDDFRTLTTCAGGHSKSERFRSGQKGHTAEIEAFVQAVLQGLPSPPPWSEIRAVALASLLAVQSLREGTPLAVITDQTDLLEASE